MGEKYILSIGYHEFKSNHRKSECMLVETAQREFEQFFSQEDRPINRSLFFGH